MNAEQMVTWVKKARHDGWEMDDQRSLSCHGYWLVKPASPHHWSVLLKRKEMSYTSRDKEGTPVTVHREETEEVEAYGWGPDSLCIDVPESYSMKALRENMRRCNLCGKTNISTERYSFAGRACHECAIKQPPPDSR
jgi:hypothetical protein